MEGDFERVVLVGDGHFATEGGGAAMRIYAGPVPPRLLTASVQRHVLADHRGSGDAVAIPAEFVGPGSTENE